MKIEKKYDSHGSLAGGWSCGGFLINGEVRLLYKENGKPARTIRYNKSDGIIKKPSEL